MIKLPFKKSSSNPIKKDRKFYQAWIAMRYRCFNEKNYIKKGIKVCRRWYNFDYFYNDLWTEFSTHYDIHGKDTQLDRKNNRGGYNKKNCRWVTQKQNTNNRDNRHIFKGKTLTEWAKILGVNRSTLAQRYYVYNWSIEKTLIN